MLRVKSLYRPLHLKKLYRDIDEEKILSSLYIYNKGSLETVISKIINEAVLGHMSLNIDSTIMQMFSINEYLSQLFMINLEGLMYNYMVHYLEERGVIEVKEEVEEKIEIISKQVGIKTELQHLIMKLDGLCDDMSS